MYILLFSLSEPVKCKGRKSERQSNPWETLELPRQGALNPSWTLSLYFLRPSHLLGNSHKVEIAIQHPSTSRGIVPVPSDTHRKTAQLKSQHPFILARLKIFPKSSERQLTANAAGFNWQHLKTILLRSPSDPPTQPPGSRPSREGSLCTGTPCQASKVLWSWSHWRSPLIPHYNPVSAFLKQSKRKMVKSNCDNFTNIFKKCKFLNVSGELHVCMKWECHFLINTSLQFNCRSMWVFLKQKWWMLLSITHISELFTGLLSILCHFKN